MQSLLVEMMREAVGESGSGMGVRERESGMGVREWDGCDRGGWV